MTWKRNLRQPSFRGVPFFAEDRAFDTGRRIHNHEYPKRDQNDPEDMGRATRELQVSGYLIGDDYMAIRDRLIAAAERNGPGQYVDRWGRSQLVSCRKLSIHESEEDGRFCRLHFDFISAGSGASAPTAIPATGAQLGAAASSLASAAVNSFVSRFTR
jgi:prophage DNA circulation protein